MEQTEHQNILSALEMLKVNDMAFKTGLQSHSRRNMNIFSQDRNRKKIGGVAFTQILNHPSSRTKRGTMS